MKNNIKEDDNMKKLSLAMISLLLLFSIAMNATGCSAVYATDMMNGVTPRAVDESDVLLEKGGDVTDFAIRLFRAANEGETNTLVSPLSVLYALAMTANGAKGQTREQMEAVLGMSAEELNLYLHAYLKALPQGKKYQLHLANSVWLSDDEDFSVNRDFLQMNADYYGADIYKAPFGKKTLKDINRWVKNETDGMIPEILDDIPDNAVMYLVNALAFEAEWQKIYEKNQVRDGTFTGEDGTTQAVKMMYDTGSFRYLEDEKATGFIRSYKDGKYAFAALLPNEGVSVSEYLDSLDGASLNALLSEADVTTVQTAIPKFEAEYSTEMSEILKSMGMPLAFDPDHADFSGLGTFADGNIYINRVFHKAFIQVGEKGTRAGAATVIEMTNKSSGGGGLKQVYLDRPFVYMLIDCENNIPFFIGTMMDVNQ
jgi:serpin B